MACEGAPVVKEDDMLRVWTVIGLACSALLMGCASGPANREPWMVSEPRLSTSTSGNVALGGQDLTETPAYQQQQVTDVQTASLRRMEPGASLANDRVLVDHQIGPMDLLEIEVFGVEELSRTVRVAANGQITLPLIGSVQAAGLSSQQLEQRIATALARDYLQDPHVSVFVADQVSQRVTVQGAVNEPGVFPMQGKTTLMQAIAMADGLNPVADAGDIRIFREAVGGRLVMSFDLNAIEDGATGDPRLQTGDIVVVDTSTGKSVLNTVTGTLRGFVRPFGPW